MKINAKNFGIAFGILWSLTLFVITVISIFTGYASDFLKILESVYPGYSVSFIGGIVGAFYGFLDGFFCFYLFALIYNFLEKNDKKE